jgi:hypothetical protein
MIDHMCEPISSTGLASSRLRRAPQDGVKTSLTFILYPTADNRHEVVEAMQKRFPHAAGLAALGQSDLV